MPDVKTAPYIKNQYFDGNGDPLAGGKLYTRYAGLSTLKTTYSESTGTSENTNPIILDSEGRCSLFLTAGPYDFELTDSADVQVWTEEGIDTFDSSTVVDTVTDLKALSPGAATFIRTLGYSSVDDGGGWWYYWSSTSTETDDGGMVIQPDSAPAVGRWHGTAPVNKELNVRIYGAVCDGVIDDIVALGLCDTWCDANGCTILIDSSIQIGTDPSLLSRVHLLPSAQLIYESFNPTFDLFIDEEDDTQHFSCTIGDVPTLSLNRVRPEWFGETISSYPITAEVIAVMTGNGTELLDKVGISTDILLDANAGADIEGGVDIAGTLEVHDAVTMHNGVTVSGSGQLRVEGVLDANGAVDIEGATDINNYLDVHYKITSHDTLQVDGSLDANLDVDVNTTLTVHGETTLLDDTRINAVLGVDVAPSAALGQVDISLGDIALVVGADSGASTRSDSTNKRAAIGTPHYTNAENPFIPLYVRSEVSDNVVQLGGGYAGGGTNATRIGFYTAPTNTSSSPSEKAYVTSDGSVVVGNPTGGAKGYGTINANAVYDDNVLLTGYVLDFFYNNTYDIDYWENLAPIAARRFFDRKELMYDIDRHCEYLRSNHALPTFEDIERSKEISSTGDMIQRLWEVAEIQAVHIDKLNERIKTLEEST